MKTYTLHTAAPAAAGELLAAHPALRRRLAAHAGQPPAARPVLCLGLDLEKAGACAVVQLGLETPLSLGLQRRAEVTALVEALRAQGWRVAAGVEACGFGWVWQGQLRAAGAEVITLATEALTGRRKTNRRDATALARVVAGRVCHGDGSSGRVVREPSVAEHRRRYLTRHRSQLIGLRGRLEAQGRGLMYDQGQEAVPESWWGKKTWPRLAAHLRGQGCDWLCEKLESLRELVLAMHRQILDLDRELAAAGATLPAAQAHPCVPAGLGELTALTLHLEVMDWARFQNRKQVGSYLGCCPSEHSTGEGQVLGNIDRQGNRRLRSALTEAVWRLLRWEPRWRGFGKWGGLLREKGASSVRKKKAVIACVRLLFIDLWRLFTGRTTLEAIGCQGKRLGFVPETAGAAE